MVSGDELISDADTEEALAEFDFLVSVSRDGAGEARSQADTDWGNSAFSFTDCITGSGTAVVHVHPSVYTLAFEPTEI